MESHQLIAFDFEVCWPHALWEFLSFISCECSWFVFPSSLCVFIQTFKACHDCLPFAFQRFLRIFQFEINPSFSFWVLFSSFSLTQLFIWFIIWIIKCNISILITSQLILLSCNGRWAMYDWCVCGRTQTFNRMRNQVAKQIFKKKTLVILRALITLRIHNYGHCTAFVPFN